MSRIAFMLACILVPIAAAAQTGQSPASLPTATSSDDIIVQALKIPREELPTGVYWNYPTILDSRIRRENAEMFFDCALNSTKPNLVRAVVDGEPNSATARFSQGRISVTHRGCYPPLPTAGAIFLNNQTTADIGQTRLDRGVIVEAILSRYAPDASLDPTVTRNPAVKSRFIAREGVRNRLRFADDRDALIFASCLVENQPVLATRLVRSDPGSQLEKGLLQAIVVEGRTCVGGAKRVTIDPTLMRVYVVDAFYRWVVAARGVDSLIPADA